MGETNIFKVLADSQRRDILIMLRNERLNAGEIAEKLQIKLSKAKGEWAYGQAKLLRALKDTGTRYQI